MAHCRQHLYISVNKNAGLNLGDKSALEAMGIGDCGNTTSINSTRYSLTDTMAIVESCFSTTPSLGGLGILLDDFQIISNQSAVSYIANNITDWEVIE